MKGARDGAWDGGDRAGAGRWFRLVYFLPGFAFQILSSSTNPSIAKGSKKNGQ